MTGSSSVSLRAVRFICPRLEPRHPAELSVTDRQQRVPGFSQQALQNQTILLVGAGGLGGEIGEGLVRKGVGRLKIFDHDTVELSNLNRQRFYEEDLYQNKAMALAKNLRREGVLGTELVAYPMSFQEAVERGLDVACTLAICGVDNNPTRSFVSRYFHERKVPVIFTAVSADANLGYVFVQEPDRACWGCLFPDEVNNKSVPCPNTPAVKDILKVVGGIVLYAVDSLVMSRKRTWNYRDLFLDGTAPERMGLVASRRACPLCSGQRT